MVTLKETLDPAQRQLLLDGGYQKSDLKIFARYYDSQAIKFTQLTGQPILNYCHQKGYTKVPLQYKQWDNGNLYATDEKNRLYVIIGSYFQKGFLLRGIVRRRRNARFTFLCNGQAGINTTQIIHLAEQDFVPFPEIEQATNEFWTLVKNKKK